MLRRIKTVVPLLPLFASACLISPKSTLFLAEKNLVMVTQSASTLMIFSTILARVSKTFDVSFPFLNHTSSRTSRLGTNGPELVETTFLFRWETTRRFILLLDGEMSGCGMDERVNWENCEICFTSGCTVNGVPSRHFERKWTFISSGGSFHNHSRLVTFARPVVHILLWHARCISIVIRMENRKRLISWYCIETTINEVDKRGKNIFVFQYFFVWIEKNEKNTLF